MSGGARWTTGFGIALGGIGGAVAALLGAPARPTPPALVNAPSSSVRTANAPTMLTAPAVSAPAVSSTPLENAATPAPPPSGPAPKQELPVSAERGATTPAALVLPTTREALLRAEVLCDRKKQYDECSRAAESLEKGTAGETDPVGAKRFRKIALTYLVKECEVGDPHACFILAAKYRAGIELKESAVRAAALEKRGLELCRLRSAPECPGP